jgi:thiol:disulfide interchange protein
MPKKMGYKTAWFILLLIVVAAVAMVAIPVWLIQPFAAQTERHVKISFLLKNWSPILTIIFALAAIALAFFIWSNSKRRFGKVALIVPLFIIFVFTWFARQNHFEWMFNPLAQASYTKASETDFVAEDDMVMAVNINGDAVAYPVRQMAYHHVVQDVVGGTPITATY